MTDRTGVGSGRRTSGSRGRAAVPRTVTVVLVALALAEGLAAQAAPGAGQVLSIEDAVQMALERSRGLKYCPTCQIHKCCP